VDDVQLELAVQGIAECSGVAARGLDTDKNFAVLKREHVSRARLSEKFPMQKRHPPVGNEPHENFAQLAQVASFCLLQLQTMLESILCEPFEPGDVHRNSSLKILDVDARQRWTAHCQTPVATFSFSARNTAVIVHTQILPVAEKLCVPIHLISSIPVLFGGAEPKLNGSVA
jgi:hypothetical protein